MHLEPLRPLHQAVIRYLMAGSVGAMHYSEPRLTLDIDIPTLATLFPEPDYYCPPADIIASEIARQDHDSRPRILKLNSLN